VYNHDFGENMQADLNRYQEFVTTLTSHTSRDLETFIARLRELAASTDPSINVPLLMTAAVGLTAEAGEFTEIPKKIFFQGKPLDDQAVFHMKRELGDIMFYWINACVSLGLDPHEVIAENVRKLESRYPGGVFDVSCSENRAAGDL
jgi:NTP pyrophosphatase (non-canonical NTP hydrolase)